MIKKRIALITTFFPPVRSVATNRMISFVEFLSEDYDICVFCLGNKKEKSELKSNVEVFYSPQNKLARLLRHATTDNPITHKVKTLGNVFLSKLISRPLKKWLDGTLGDLIKAHKENPFDCIISSHAPPEAHSVAIEFKISFNDVPWIADMRDEMSLNPGLISNQVSYYKNIEKLVNQYANALTTVSKPILEDFKTICPDILHFEEIRNGFNHNYVKRAGSSKNEVFQIGYFGKFYGEIKPHNFFKAISVLLSENADLEFEIHFVGVHNNFNIPEELSDRVYVHASVSYDQAIERMGEMNLNLLVLPKTSRRGVYSGKLFDYLSVQQPILAAVDKTDVAAELIDEMKAGYIADFESIDGIKEAFSNAYNDWEKGILRIANDSQVNTLHRKFQVEKLKNLIEEITVK